jgi:DNA polymerase-3 subunit delta
MQLYPEKIQAHLKQQLLPIYFVSGDEPLQLQEACDAIRSACREYGCEDREIMHVDRSFDWQELLASSASMSLFGAKRLLELRMPSAKPGDKGSKALVQYTKQLNGDDILLIISDKVEPASKRSKWFKALDGAGATIQVWPIESQQLPNWVNQRLRSVGLNASRDAIEIICERVEGNLLAAFQEIEKLRLTVDSGIIDAETVNQAVSNNARYDLFSLIDRALLGNAKHCLKMLHGLRGEGTDATVILWALSREIRALYQCRSQLDQGQPLGVVFKDNRIWDKRKGLVEGALQRLDKQMLSDLLELAATTDDCIKGLIREDAWQKLADLTLGLCGIRLSTASHSAK